MLAVRDSSRLTSKRSVNILLKALDVVEVAGPVGDIHPDKLLSEFTWTG